MGSILLDLKFSYIVVILLLFILLEKKKKEKKIYKFALLFVIVDIMMYEFK